VVEYPQSFRRGFRCQIALRRRNELEPDHEFAQRRRSKKRRIEMRVQMIVGIVAGPQRLMKSHRIRKWRLEQIVVAGRQLLENGRERIASGIVEVPER